MLPLGIRLQLMIGPTIAVPAPYPLVDALRDVEVHNNDRERDGFQMTFTLGRNSPLDYPLLSSGLLDPPARVTLMVWLGALPEVLIDGIITTHQVSTGDRPGTATLTVTGEDVSAQMDLTEVRQTYGQQAASTIVQQVLARYPQLNLVPAVTPTTWVVSSTEQLTTQQSTDLAFIRSLGEDYGFVFYVEPIAPGANLAYWGPAPRTGELQPALTFNMGTDSNVSSGFQFGLNALAGATPLVTITDASSQTTMEIPIPASPDPLLAAEPTPKLRTTILRLGNQTTDRAILSALAYVEGLEDSTTTTGELDAVRYGAVLRARRLVGVRGVGYSYDGTYYVKSVSHRIKRGEYKQSFTLTRDGRGALAPVVVP